MLDMAALIQNAGNPSVILIDEFSTGIDAKMKRDMWSTLKNISIGKAVVITTRTYFFYCLQVVLLKQQCNLDSMEEASALANKVGIIASRMLGECFQRHYYGEAV